MRVYVARHGETTWNREGRYQGRRESELTGLGERQAAALAGAMAPHALSHVVTSPLGRCRLTGAPSAEAVHAALTVDDELIEIAHGTWEGRLRDEIAANDPVRYRAWREDPANVSFEGGESVRDVAQRWSRFAAAFAPAGPALVVTHDAVARVALCAAQGLGLDAFWKVRAINGGFAVYNVDDGRWTLVEELVDAHLDGLRADHERQAL